MLLARMLRPAPTNALPRGKGGTAGGTAARTRKLHNHERHYTPNAAASMPQPPMWLAARYHATSVGRAAHSHTRTASRWPPPLAPQGVRHISDSTLVAHCSAIAAP